ncbi:MAG TPA: YggT family protein [Gammaproteobacteria bacterium]|jgi:YggT family protein|nr:YggT family protein [Gammaproteobacteria bacterium]
MNYAANAATLIIDTIIGLYLYIILVRFWMQWVRADFRNPVGQFVISTTSPFIIPLRKLLPPIGMVDTATLVFALIVAIIKVAALFAVVSSMPSAVNILVFGASEVLRSSIHIFMASVFIMIIASWIASGSYNPIVSVAQQIAHPLMAPAQRLLPNIGGFDLSPILVILFLNLSLVLLVAPISPFI